MVDAYRRFTFADTAFAIRAPRPHDDKYSRGVLGIATGSDRYPGAAVLAVEAAVRTGIGMVRYVGDDRPTALVLYRRPEVVTGIGRVQAWLIGSGTVADERTTAEHETLVSLLTSGVPIVLDAGGLDLVEAATGPVLVTPHYRELSAMLVRAGYEVDPEAVAADPGRWAAEAAHRWNIAVLLKGQSTYVAGGATRIVVSGSTPWLATAGSGDVLGGIVGAVVAGAATDAGLDLDALARLGAAAAMLHARAGGSASRGGPIAALDIAEHLPEAVRRVLHGGVVVSRR